MISLDEQKMRRANVWKKPLLVIQLAFTYGIFWLSGNCLALDLRFFKAIHSVESGGRFGAIIGDNGQALGPLQIHKRCWIDSKVKGKYMQCADFNYSVKVMEGYLKRYCPKAVQENNFEIMARTWNGGPSQKGTDGYWKKVKQAIDK